MTPRDPWPAVTLVVIALVLSLGFQSFQLFREGQALQTARAGQETTMREAQKLRAQLDAIAQSTLKLAEQGNTNAAAIVQDLARRGVTIAGSQAAPGKPAVAPSK